MAKHSKEEIINKGIELMRKNGYHGTGVQQVLKECHIPKGSFYHFFESKQDFALQAIDQYADDTIQHLMSIFERPVTECEAEAYQILQRSIEVL